MIISLFQRSYPFQDAPVAFTFFPSGGHQRHTFTVGEKVYEAEFKEVRVTVPEAAKVDPLRNVLGWVGDKGPVKSTAKEVYELAAAGTSGFRLEK